MPINFWWYSDLFYGIALFSDRVKEFQRKSSEITKEIYQCLNGVIYSYSRPLNVSAKVKGVGNQHFFNFWSHHMAHSAMACSQSGDRWYKLYSDLVNWRTLKNRAAIVKQYFQKIKTYLVCFNVTYTGAKTTLVKNIQVRKH